MQATFERDEASVDELLVVEVPHEATSRGREELHLRDTNLPSDSGREGHNSIGDDAGDRWRAALLGGEPRQQGPERGGAVAVEGVDEHRRVVLRDGEREAVVDDLHAERRSGQAGGADGGLALGADEAGVVELGVDEGDDRATGVEEARELE